MEEKKLLKEYKYYKKLSELLLDGTYLRNSEIAKLREIAVKYSNDCIYLTEKQKENLSDIIYDLKDIRNRDYRGISFHSKPVEHTRLWFSYSDEELDLYDSFAGNFVPWQNYGNATFVEGKIYSIQDLLG